MDLARALRTANTAFPLELDILCHSRGVLVARSLTEEVLPQLPERPRVRRMVFVGGTNAGTELVGAGQPNERVAMLVTMLLFAGHESVASHIGFGVARLANDEALRKLLVDAPERIVPAVDDAAAEVRSDDFNLVRALMSRRSGAQLRAWTTGGDITPYLPAFATLGSLPDTDLSE